MCLAQCPPAPAHPSCWHAAPLLHAATGQAPPEPPPEAGSPLGALLLPLSHPNRGSTLWAIRLPLTPVSSSLRGEATSNTRHICLRPLVLDSGSLETQFQMILTSQEAIEPVAGGSWSWKGSPWEVGVLSQGAVGPRSVLPLGQMDLVVYATEFPRGKV